MRSLAAWLAGTSLVLAACASTGDDASEQGGRRRREEPSPSARDAPADVAESTSPQPAGEARASGTQGPAQRAADDASSPGAAPRAPSANRTTPLPAPQGPLGQGVSAGKIKIGFWVLDVSAACGATGVKVATCEDDDVGEIQAINGYINSHGGIAGRAIEPVIVKSAIDRSHAAQAQAACESFALDHKVFAVLVPPQPQRPHLPVCLARHGVPVIDAGMWPFDRVDHRKVAGFLYRPDRPRPERWVKAYVDGLHAQGFFERRSRIGLVRWDAAPFARVTDEVLEKRLAAHGLKLAEEAAIAPPDGMTGYGAMNAQINSAILRFNRSGVDRVLFFADIGELQTFWFPAAESQGYRPRYGFSSTDTPGQSLESLAPRAQLRGALGVGWNPIFDVRPELDPGGSAAAARCKKILQDAGQDPGAGRNLKCDSAFFLKAALERAPALNIQGFRAAVDGLGERFEPSGTFATRFGPGRWDGPSLVRYLAFAESCGCFRYASGPKPLP